MQEGTFSLHKIAHLKDVMTRPQLTTPNHLHRLPKDHFLPTHKHAPLLAGALGQRNFGQMDGRDAVIVRLVENGNDASRNLTPQNRSSRSVSTMERSSIRLGD